MADSVDKRLEEIRAAYPLLLHPAIAALIEAAEDGEGEATPPEDDAGEYRVRRRARAGV